MSRPPSPSSHDAMPGAGREVVITRPGGFVGRAVAQRLIARGWKVTGLSRSPESAAVGMPPEMQWVGIHALEGEEAVQRAGHVVHLAGAQGVEQATSRKEHEAMWLDRLETTTRIARIVARSKTEAPVLVTATGVGIYGECGDVVVDEEHAAETSSVGRWHSRWEGATREAAPHVRIATMRVGIPLRQGHGLLRALERPSAYHACRSLPAQEAYLPWVDARDLVDLFVSALESANYAGTFNATAPEPARLSAMLDELGGHISPPSWGRAAAFFARPTPWPESDALERSCRAIPSRALAAGFSFSHGSLPASLASLYGARPSSARWSLRRQVAPS